MPVKRRRAKGRTHRITPEAVAAYKVGDALALHMALGLKPWEESPLDVDDGPPPSWAKPGHAVYDTWEQAQRLRRLLRKVAR